MPEVPEQIQDGIAHLELEANEPVNRPVPTHTPIDDRMSRGYNQNGGAGHSPANGQHYPTMTPHAPPDEPNFSPFPKLKSLPPNVPPSDEEKEKILWDARLPVLNSNDPEMQLAWGQDALAYVDAAMTHEARISEIQQARPATPQVEHQLRVDAMNVVSFLADQAHPKAEFMRGMWLEFGKFGQRQDKREAFRCYQRASERGYSRAEYRMGMQFEQSNDPMKALQHYKKGAEEGDSASNYRLGMMTLLGQAGQPQDYARGVQLLLQAAATADENAPQGAYVRTTLRSFFCGHRLIQDRSWVCFRLASLIKSKSPMLSSHTTKERQDRILRRLHTLGLQKLSSKWALRTNSALSAASSIPHCPCITTLWLHGRVRLKQTWRLASGFCAASRASSRRMTILRTHMLFELLWPVCQRQCLAWVTSTRLDFVYQKTFRRLWNGTRRPQPLATRTQKSASGVSARALRLCRRATMRTWQSRGSSRNLARSEGRDRTSSRAEQLLHLCQQCRTSTPKTITKAARLADRRHLATSLLEPHLRPHTQCQMALRWCLHPATDQRPPHPIPWLMVLRKSEEGIHLPVGLFQS